MIVVLKYNHLKELFFNKNKHTEWLNILNRPDVEIQLIVNEEEKEYLFDTNTDIYRFMHLFNNGSYFKFFDSDVDFNVNPNYIFFESDINRIKSGSLIISQNTYENPFKLQYFKTLIKGKTSNNWKTIFDNRTLISNALIINDPYIFHCKDDEKSYEIRDQNIIKLIDNIIPNDLDIPYHILIYTSTIVNTIDNERIFQTRKYYEQFILNLIDKIAKLREYKIEVEIVIGKAIHKRKLFTNYLNITTDKGFKIFDINNSKVLEYNDILIETIFTRNNPISGDSQFDEMKIRLNELKNSLDNSLHKINSEENNFPHCFYFSNTTNSKPIVVKNRLFKI